jgi:hypothetical protein
VVSVDSPARSPPRKEDTYWLKTECDAWSSGSRGAGTGLRLVSFDAAGGGRVVDSSSC